MREGSWCEVNCFRCTKIINDRLSNLCSWLINFTDDEVLSDRNLMNLLAQMFWRFALFFCHIHGFHITSELFVAVLAYNLSRTNCVCWGGDRAILYFSLMASNSSSISSLWIYLLLLRITNVWLYAIITSKMNLTANTDSRTKNEHCLVYKLFWLKP